MAFHKGHPQPSSEDVWVIQAEAARKGIVAMVVAGISTIVAVLVIYALTSPSRGSERSPPPLPPPAEQR